MPNTPSRPKSNPEGGGPCPGEPVSTAVPALLARYGARLHGTARRMCGNEPDADDLVQDVFLTATAKWPAFRGESDPGTWLYTNAARACARKMKRRRRRSTTTAELMPWHETTVTALGAGDPAGRAERQEAVGRVQDAVSRLDEHLRLPVVLREVLGMSVEETARSLGLAENTVKTRLHRARLALRKALMAGARPVVAPAPIYEKRVCMDLLKAKMDAMDRGGGAFCVPQAELCARCRTVFRELDLVQDACAAIAQGRLPDHVRRAVLAAAGAGEPAQPRRGRKPLGRSARS